MADYGNEREGGGIISWVPSTLNLDPNAFLSLPEYIGKYNPSDPNRKLFQLCYCFNQKCRSSTHTAFGILQEGLAFVFEGIKPWDTIINT